MKTPARGARCGAGERGSALLIVFVFAAMVAIMLYMEMPVAVFEAQRQKEQLLVDRGNEYSHAVKLFVRKLRTYPASMEALENTNQMRFLRHRFKDPFTGKDDWRILHAGPNGTLVDSKVKPLGLGQNGGGANGTNDQNGSTTSSANFGSASNRSNSTPGSSGFGSNGFGGSGFGSSGSDSSSTTPEVVVPALTQRAPAVAANGSGAPVGAGGEQNGSLPVFAPGSPEANALAQVAAGATLQSPGVPAQNGADPGVNGTPGSGPPGAAGQAGNGSAADAFRNALANPNAFGQQGTPGSPMGTSQQGTGMGVIGGSGIAGVASKAAGHSIKIVNDQTDYSLWEFYYDPTKDTAGGLANALGAMGAGQQTNPQQNGFGQNQQQNGFGTNSQQNGFGTNSQQNGFGTNPQQNGFGTNPQQNGFGQNSAIGTGNPGGMNNAFGSGTGSPNNSNGPTATPFPSPQQQQPPQ